MKIFHVSLGIKPELAGYAIPLLRRKPASEEAVAPWKTMQMGLSKSGLTGSVSLSPTARMQLFLHQTDLGHGTFLIFGETRFKKQLSQERCLLKYF
jgi:hypothetical protein